uniref:SRCR domain-containing protein n=1 Tax=Cyprinus carpio TaxID=7962 RepID=A0A8C2EN68_CYPCA
MPSLFSLQVCMLLVNGDNNCSGRVEIFYDGMWGTVCDDGWDINDATVLCRQLRCGKADSAHESAHFGQGSGQIWLDDVGCTGHETSLTQCSHSSVGTHNCGHSEDAGVVCIQGKIIFYIQHTDKLVNGVDSCCGRVEIYHNGQWGTVCDDNWDMTNAAVVCRQLECGSAISALHNAAFGQGSGSVWLDDVKCLGSEGSLTQCSHSELGTHDCNHGEDAGVVCSDTRLVNGVDSCCGRVEIYHNGQWGTVCDDNWDMTNAAVVCRQLECGSAISALHNAAFGQGSGSVWLDDVKCLGSEGSLTQCSHSELGTHDCNHGEDAGVVCSDTRLVNGVDSCCGRVEIYHNGQWGTVCDDNWDMTNAAVVCRQLECGSAISALHNAAFGQGSGSVWLDDVKCLGSEGSLTQCSHSELGTHDCNHGEDAGVVCSGKLNL